MTSHASGGDEDGTDVITSAPRDLLALGGREDPEDVLASGLEEAIATIRRRTARLAYLIIRRDYLQAWCEASDLRRALEQAEVLAFGVLELAESSDGAQRLDEAGCDAEGVLKLAPNPSAEATRRAFAQLPQTDRTLWDREVAQWITKLAAHKPPALVAADSLTPSTGDKKRSALPRAGESGAARR